MKPDEAIVEAAVGVDAAMAGGHGNGKRVRRVAAIAVALTLFGCWTWFNDYKSTQRNDKVLGALGEIQKAVGVVKAQQDTTAAWVKFHQAWSENAVRQANQATRRLWRAIGRPDEFDPIQ